MPHIISHLRLTFLSTMFAKNSCIDTEDQVLIDREYFQKYFGDKCLEENGQIKFEFFANLYPLIDTSEKDLSINEQNKLINKFIGEFEIRLKRTRIMLDQQFMDNTLRSEMDRFNSENKLITKVLNDKWKISNLYEILNQFYIEFEGDERANKNNNDEKKKIIKIDDGKYDDGELRKYLDKIYHLDDDVKANRKGAIQWIEKQVEMWLNKQCSSVGIKYKGTL
ncbi:unnamed protein product [Meloidogyne enterolobii]|uniref:Uncharacterized protein n=1 Tax=Meloidogyne enterolobii TaxID=390850 RepID=A0ACB0YAU0_MELEN